MERNRVYVGDALELIKGLENKSVDCVYTDVPYLYECGGGGSSDVALRIHANADRLAEAGIDKGFDMSIFSEFARVMKKVNMFIWCSKLQIFDIANWWLNWAKERGVRINYEVLCWCKANPTPATNNVWLPDIEYCLYFREQGVRLNNGYEHKHKWYMSGLNVSDKADYGHPTCKPLEFVSHHILHTTQPGDLILDPYCGSGTTLVAAKRNGRDYIGFDISEEWCGVSRDRLQGWNTKGEMNLFDVEW